MNLSRYLTPLAKIMPLVKPQPEPKHAGEVYYLWESLTAGHKIVVFLETYLMNTEDTEMRLLLQGIAQVIERYRLQPMEDLLKREGFAVPPRPGTKRFQGLPGAEQGMKLSNDEILRGVVTWAQMGLNLDARALAAAVSDDIRAAFIRLLREDMKQYTELLDLAREREVYYDPPAATAASGSLNVDEVARLWEELGARHLTMINMEAFLANTDDRELTGFLKHHIRKTAYPQLEILENTLKEGGFTVPPRPADRRDQGSSGRLTKITLSDADILGELVLGAQVAIAHHVRSYTVAARKDVRDLFAGFVATEIDEYEKLLDLAKGRHALETAPLVSARQA